MVVTTQLINWEQIFRPKIFGEFGILNLRLFDKCMLRKRWWRYHSELSKPWRILIYSIHHRYKATSYSLTLRTPKASHACIGVIEVCSLFKACTEHKIRDGRQTIFQSDCQFKEWRMNDQFQNLFMLINKTITIHKLLKSNNL